MAILSLLLFLFIEHANIAQHPVWKCKAQEQNDDYNTIINRTEK